MIAFLCAISAIASPVCSDHQLDTHWFSQYGKSPTDGTILYRQSVGDIPMDLSLYDGVVAVEDCLRIGDEAMINVDGRWRRVIAFDCLARNETNWMQEKNIIAELGYYISKEMELPELRGVRGKFTWMD